MTRIVVGHDGSEAADDALDWALAVAAMRSLPVTVVRAWDLVPISAWSPVPPSEDELRSLAAAETAEVEAAAQRARERAPGITVEAHAVQGRVATVLSEAAGDAALLVVGRRGAGLARLGLGSSATAALHAAECPVALVPAGWNPSAEAERRVVVGWDGSATAVAALRWAAEAAERRGAALDVVLAWQISTLHHELTSDDVTSVPPLSAYEELADRQVDAAVAQVREQRPGLTVRGTAVRAQAARALLEQGEGADLLVVGSRGIGGFRGLILGSTSDQVSRHAACPTVVVRAGQERLDDALPSPEAVQTPG